MQAHSSEHQHSVLDYIVDSGCCAYRQWEHCSFSYIEQQCTKDGDRILKLILSKFLGGVPEFICSKQLFSPGSKICNKLPDLKTQRGQINWAKLEDQKFSLFSFIKYFLVRDTTSE